jgi:hypothetical protein
VAQLGDLERCAWISEKHMGDSEKNDGLAQCSRAVVALATDMRLHELEISRTRKQCSRMLCLDMRDVLRANADGHSKVLSLQI